MHVLIGDVAASRCSLFQSGNHPTNWLTCRLAIRPQRVFRSLNRLNHFSCSFLIKLSNVIICILWKLFCKHFHKETTTLYLYSVSYTNKLAYIIKVAANCSFAFYVGPKTFCTSRQIKDLLTPFWLFSAMPALIIITNTNSIVFGE